MERTHRPFARIYNQLRAPAYTGENRCRPCTVLNSLIALVIAGGVALISIPLAVVAVVVFAGVILFRGYLIPGTPTLVQFLPDVVHDAIGGTHHGERTLEEVTVDPTVDVETLLYDAAIVEDCAATDDLCMTGEFRARWTEKMTALQDRDKQRASLGRTIDVPTDSIRFEETDAGWFVFVDEMQAGRWPSRAAFVTDLASETLLKTTLTNWEAIPGHDRARILASLRAFAEECPTCGGEITNDERVIASCCRGETVSVETVCTGCNSVLFEGTER